MTKKKTKTEMDQAWYTLRRLLVDDNVEVKYWNY